ncbi:PAQR family membrane homeostasis protein TrhA [Vagococcus xieshaowenii]|uniref:Hemolysin III family protein n=1 Tax=Vagococcus xieshaowenii TaxID=2562451 RepID=A0AAJ5EEG0_9ENTE|nr:hemolysin III family protein [Vagococcus xieshaowenii]QCA28695.1 hemolysin III family protein [Vagococcus xieshaowenii]TFZ40497.1 hemolysin III family protein [Vagococcus xieshaowenii]
MSQRKYDIVNEVFNAITHGLGCLAAISGLIFLLIKAVSLGKIYMFAYLVFGLCLTLLFLSSTLFHSLIFTKARNFFQIMDHCSIYLLIAGSYTPYCLLTIQGKKGWILFSIIWLLAIGGVIYKSFFINKKWKFDFVIYLFMGWLCLVACRDLYDGLGWNGILLLVLGGLSYSLGTIFYALQNKKFMHVVWHLFVLAGAAFIYFSIYLYT